MSPILVKGDEVGLLPTAAASLQAGDIVVLIAGSTFVTHRFWGCVGELLVTKGDRSLAFDPLWMPTDLLGQVALRRRAGSPLPLRKGRGATLNQRIFSLARLELQMFAGFSNNPLEGTARERWLGRQLRRNRSYLPARIIRQAFRFSAGLLVGITVGHTSQDSSSGDWPYAQTETEV
jgi:hypothetical protein